MRAILPVLMICALLFTNSAFAVYQVCENKGGTVKIELDADSHPIVLENGDIKEAEAHIYIDSIDYGAGNILQEPISQEKIVKVDGDWTMGFEQGIILKPIEASPHCDISYEFEHKGHFERSAICCRVE